MAARIVKRGSGGSRKPSKGSGVRVVRNTEAGVRDSKTGQQRIKRKK